MQPERPPDLLSGASWSCARSAPGAIDGPAALGAAALDWVAAAVPGTVGGALREAGRLDATEDLDASDWWYRTRVDLSAPGTFELSFGGLATIADVWVGGEHVLHAENMFRTHRLEVELGAGSLELVLRFGSLVPLLEQKRPRPRWKTYLPKHQNLRWLRTCLLGRLLGWVWTPPPVGPWRPVELREQSSPSLLERHLTTELSSEGGSVRLSARLANRPGTTTAATLCVGGVRAPLHVEHGDGVDLLEGGALVADAAPWWPHTHGAQPLYPVSLEVDGAVIDLGRVGFRSLEIDRRDDGFQLVANGVPVFCRGAVWLPIDPVTFTRSREELRAELELVREAGMNMLRVPGTGIYEDDEFYDCCDELGILVWQDCAFAFFDPPDEPDFVAGLLEELADVFAPLSGRPSLAVVCGGQEISSQAAMLGVPRDRWDVPLLEETVRDALAELVPGTPYVGQNPTGGDLPFQMNAGLAHYFGVGGYVRPLEEVRRAGVRFATETLAFATPPEAGVMERVWGDSSPAGHDPAWKRGVHHDERRGWDLEDVQAHYVRELFGADPVLSRWIDADRAQDLARAAVGTAMEEVFSEWRSAGSPCAGGLVLALHDLGAGGGWGVIDAWGRPKAPWFALKRVLQPVALLLTDEGLNGLRLHLVNDTPEAIDAQLSLRVFARGELAVARATRAVRLEPRSVSAIDATSMLDEWWDLTLAYGFGPPALDVVVAGLRASSGELLSEVFHFPRNRLRGVETDLGLEATLERCEDRWFVSLSTRRVAQYVVVDFPGYHASDSWFHLAPGGDRRIELRAIDEHAPEHPMGIVRALNASGSTRILPESADVG